MITHGLSSDLVEFGHFVGGQMTPLTPPPPGYGPACLAEDSSSTSPVFDVSYYILVTDQCAD